MANRIAATYAGTSSTRTHTITFTPPTPGARLIAVVTTYWHVENDPPGWEMVYSPEVGWNYVYFYIRVATGSETSVSFTLYQSHPSFHAVIYERDDCQELKFATTGETTGSQVQATATVPQGGGRVFAVVNNAVSGSNLVWPAGLVEDFTASGTYCYSYFASGEWPAPGQRTWTVTGLKSSSNESVLAVVGFGTADATPPAAPANLRVVTATPYAVTLAWDAATDDVGVAGYGVYLDGVKHGPDVTGTTTTITGLSPGRSYRVGVDAVDSAGNRSPVVEITVTPDVDQPPAPPGNLRAVHVGGTTVTVAWDEAVDDYALAGYGVYLNGVARELAHPHLEYTFAGLARGVTYLVEVDAVDSAGNRSERAALEVTTVASTLPSTPDPLSATPEGDTISLAWGASVDDTRVVRYEILLDGQVVGTTTELAYVIDSLVPGVTYLVQVRAVDEDDGRSEPATAVVTVPPPPWTAVASPTYQVGEWAGNTVDEHGVTWVVEREAGWSSTPPVTVPGEEAAADDGGFSGPGRFQPRTITLEGVAVAPTRSAMVHAQERLLAALSPRQAGLLRVVEAHTTRQAQVRLGDAIEITDINGLAFRWVLTLVAEDPRRYAVQPVYAEASPPVLPGAGEVVVDLEGDYPAIPGVLTVYGPIRNFTITHVESGLVIAARDGVVLPADDRYRVEIDLRTRLVWAHVPPEVDPEPRPARSLLARFPSRFALQPGRNTLRLEGEATGDEGRPRLTVHARNAWC